MLSQTFNEVFIEMETQFRFKKASIVLTWSESPALAAPLNLFEVLSSALVEGYLGCSRLYARCRYKGTSSTAKGDSLRFVSDADGVGGGGDGGDGDENDEEHGLCFPSLSFTQATSVLQGSLNSGSMAGQDFETPRRLLVESIFKSSPFIGLSLQLLDAISNVQATASHLEPSVSVQRVLDRETRQSVRRILDMFVLKLRSKGASTFEILEEMDANGDGVISVPELGRGLATLGIKVTPDELDALMRYFDVDKNGTLDALELETTIRSHCIPEEVELAFDSTPQAMLRRALESASREPSDRTMRDVRCIVNVVQSVPFFAALSAFQCRQICRVLKLVLVPAGADVFVQGETGSHFYILIDGEATVLVDGHVVKSLEAVVSFGELALQVPGGKRTATVNCTVACVLLCIEAYAYRAAISPEKAQQEILESIATPAALRSEADYVRIVEVLGSVDSLRHYPPPKLRKIAEACHSRRLAPNETLFAEGDVADHFYVLMEGELEVLVKDLEEAKNETHRAVKVLVPRSAFGEAALHEQDMPMATVRCKSESAQLLAVQRGDFMAIVNEWKHEEAQQLLEKTRARTEAALRRFKLGTPLWLSGSGLGIVDAVLRSEKVSFVVSYRTGVTNEYDVDTMLSQVKRLPVESIRSDDVEVYRRSRLAMLVMLLQRTASPATLGAKRSAASIELDARKPLAETDGLLAVEQRLRAVEAAVETTSAIASNAVAQLVELSKAIEALGAAMQLRLARPFSPDIGPDPPSDPPPLYVTHRQAPPRRTKSPPPELRGSIRNDQSFPRRVPMGNGLPVGHSRQPRPRYSASEVWAAEPIGPSVLL